MSSSRYNGTEKKKEKKTVEEEEVDELLKAAQDDMLLKLSLNSHSTHSSSSQFSGIDPDLDSRFQALTKKPQKSNSKPAAKTQKNPERILQNVDESDDLLGRFAALKSSLPSYNNNTSTGGGGLPVQQQQQQLIDERDGDGGGEEEDEVEKLIKWAIDTARLDPSPPSDSDHGADDDDSSNDDVDDDDDDDDGKKSKRK